MPGHPLWSYLARAGLRRELEELASDPCPPDIVGLDYYPPSERFLDDRLERYPARTHTSNGRDRYADLDAVRVLADGPTGFERLALEAWRRYRLPLAATEVHLGCTREEQLRWLKEIWDAALRLRARGADVRAVTAWALLGSYDWDSLLTRRRGHYEPGAFDVRGQQPRATAVARMVRDLATRGRCRASRAGRARLVAPEGSPGLASGRHPTGQVLRARPWRLREREARPLLITGGSGRLGRAVVRSCIARGLPYQAPSRGELDITDPRAVAAAMESIGRGRWSMPPASLAPRRRKRTPRGAGAPISTARRSWRRRLRGSRHPAARLVDPSGVRWPRAPSVSRERCAGPARRLCVEQTRSGAGGARLLPAGARGPRRPPVRAVGSGRPGWAGDPGGVCRTTLLGCRGRHDLALISAAPGRGRARSSDRWGMRHLAPGQPGCDHACGFRTGRRTWGEPRRGRIQAVPAAELGWVAPKPLYSVLGSSRGLLMPPLDQAIAAYLEAAPDQWSSAPAG